MQRQPDRGAAPIEPLLPLEMMGRRDATRFLWSAACRSSMADGHGVIVSVMMVVAMAMPMAVRVGVVGTRLSIVGHIMMMEGEESLDKEHGHEAGQGPKHHAIDRAEFGQSVWHHVQQSNAEHGASYEADRQLHALVRQANDEGNPAAGQRGQQHKNRVASKRNVCGHVGRSRQTVERSVRAADTKVATDRPERRFSCTLTGWQVSTGETLRLSSYDTCNAAAAILLQESGTGSMRACVQRVSSASVDDAGRRVGEIGSGLLILLGVAAADAPADVDVLARKIIELRIFDDDQGRMNRGLLDVGGGLLVVSQFTLLADCRRGRRPSYTSAAKPALAEGLYELFVARCRESVALVATGVFREHMDVALVNDGPVTIWLDTRELNPPAPTN